MKTRYSIALVGLFFLLNSEAYALHFAHPKRFADYQDHLYSRQNELHYLAQQNYHHGLLTDREFDRILRAQNEVKELICRYERDGRFSRYEVKRLQKKLRKVAFNIRRLSGNAIYAGKDKYRSFKRKDRIRRRDQYADNYFYIQW